jgi:hypothetical protein
MDSQKYIKDRLDADPDLRVMYEQEKVEHEAATQARRARLAVVRPMVKSLLQWAAEHSTDDKDAQELFIEVAESVLRELERDSHGGCIFCGN